MTGVVDAAFGICLTEAVPEVGVIEDAFTTITLSAKQTYWIPVTSEDINKINQKHPWKVVLMPVPKGLVGENAPPEDTGLITFIAAFTCWDTADEEMVYELVKFFDENAEEYTRRTLGRPIGGELMAAFPGLTEQILHPGALRYYKEKGYKLGV